MGMVPVLCALMGVRYRIQTGQSIDSICRMQKSNKSSDDPALPTSAAPHYEKGPRVRVRIHADSSGRGLVSKQVQSGRGTDPL